MKAKNLAITKFSVAAIILSLMGFWIFKTTKPLNEFGYGIIGVMLLIVGFVIYSGIQALKDAKLGLTPEDELSKTITQKAAATAFRISIFMWLFVLFALDLFPVDSVNKAKFVIAIGMVGMTLIFLFSRLYLSKVGVDDNQD
ncbi:hypothetical protein [Imperialibacter roseus]|uniref:DUF2178 domain-containing protein n=1 Tax=Imperialibacter roseus TaxID=1324217 RepID=A0ABZ0IIX7_9BACT|nr:hypothetical protein [Imperialibacter roseus]WOK04467.1 hypothetical protein RT717_15405 [Imperialibacter roseus]|tara:strand:- start:43356 stop:43781 length:426 start_codon:yes stop_codon:yes gene_type:complete